MQQQQQQQEHWVVNDIYLFSDDSVAKYFGMSQHLAIMSNINLKKYIAENPSKSTSWCSKVVQNPPSNDYYASLSICSEFLVEALKGDNIADILCAHVLIQIVPLLPSAVPKAFLEDTYVHDFIAPLITPVANGKLGEHDSKQLKPDFAVYTTVINRPCTLLIGEFKPTNSNSSVESDVKLGRQMRSLINSLVQVNVSHPTVCRLLSEGSCLSLYAMDLKPPHLYRMVRLTKVDLCLSMGQVNHLPILISNLTRVKNIVIKTAEEAEAAIIAASEDLRRPPSTPPKSWLSSDAHFLSRKRRKSNQGPS